MIARNSSFTYKGQAVDVKQVGGELGVRYMLEGSVRKAGDIVAKLRAITAQVVPSAQPWRNPEDRELYFSGLRMAAGEDAGPTAPTR